MAFLGRLVRDALDLIGQFGAEMAEVVWLTLLVAIVATAFGVLIGVPLGTWLALVRSTIGRWGLVLVNTGMGMPPVLAGLVILLVVWDDGPLGSLELAFTVPAMIVAQTLLAIPIAAGVTAGAVRTMAPAAREQLAALGVSLPRAGVVALRDVWPGVAAAVVAAFGRVVSEVGAVLVVGGNIEGETRVLTTAIVSEAHQADFAAALAFGVVLMAIALSVNLLLTYLQLRESPPWR